MQITCIRTTCSAGFMVTFKRRITTRNVADILPNKALLNTQVAAPANSLLVEITIGKFEIGWQKLANDMQFMQSRKSELCFLNMSMPACSFCYYLVMMSPESGFNTKAGVFHVVGTRGGG